MSEGVVAIAGFGVEDNGVVVRTGVAEDEAAEIEDIPQAVVLGRGKRAKQGTTKYGPDWESQ